MHASYAIDRMLLVEKKSQDVRKSFSFPRAESTNAVQTLKKYEHVSPIFGRNFYLI